MFNRNFERAKCLTILKFEKLLYAALVGNKPLRPFTDVCEFCKQYTDLDAKCSGCPIKRIERAMCFHKQWYKDIKSFYGHKLYGSPVLIYKLQAVLMYLYSLTDPDIISIETRVLSVGEIIERFKNA